MRFVKKIIFFVILLSSFATAHSAERTPSRILSLAPAATEILFDLGLGNRVVGVTQYCNWPPEARRKPVVGDIMRPNLEVILSYKPDIVMLSNMNAHLRERIEAVGLPTVVVGQDDFEQICDSILHVGEACGVSERARARVKELRSEVAALHAKPPKKGALIVLVVVGRDTSDPSFKQVYGAGKRSFYNDLLEEAGARNVLKEDVPYVRLSREGLIRLDPDMVLELLGEHGSDAIDMDTVLEQWRAFTDLKAAREGNIALIHGDFTLRAGPRYPMILRAFLDTIHNGKRMIAE